LITLPDRYEYLGTKLEGGQGVILLCKDKFLDRTVAIKVMQDLHHFDSILNEASTIKSIQSKHVVELYDLLHIEEEGKKSIALIEEYIPGSDLEDYSSTSPNADDYIKILYQISAGIADIHNHNHIHRDIKPMNMKCNDEGIVKIFDFGFAIEIEDELKTEHGRGTIAFRAPELYHIPSAEYDSAVDVYAFGVSAWFLVDKRIPDALWEMPPQRTNLAPSFSNIGLDLPHDVISILDQTLKVNPDERPSMNVVRDTLARRINYGRHRALLTYNNASKEISEINKKITLSVHGITISIKYDGLYFIVENINGDVYINNRDAIIGESLPGSCVITLGALPMGFNRTFIAFDVSHPEVVL